MYKLFYYMMLIGYLGVSLQGVDLRMKLVGILLFLVNLLIFWR